MKRLAILLVPMLLIRILLIPMLLTPILPLLSCKKTGGPGTGARSFTAPNPATQGALLTEEVDRFPDGDSLVITYQYDAARRLIAMLKTGFSGNNTFYTRDDEERITRMITTQDSISDTIDVFYASPTLGVVSYTLGHFGEVQDSEVYHYNQDHYTTSIAFYSLTVLPAQFGGLDSITYDANGNVAQFQTGTPEPGGQFSLNLGYDFQYDNDINPLYSYDDCRMVNEEAAIISPNNQMKQTNHYGGNPPPLPSDYVTYTYRYRSDKKPSSAATGGTAASANEVPVTTYYYQ
jgi:hypothetical protein